MTDKVIDLLPDGALTRSVDARGNICYRDVKGRLHNPDGPARIYPDTGATPEWWWGTQEWWWHGQMHRTDGPAVVRGDGLISYWVDDNRVPEDEFFQRYPAAQRNQPTHC